MALCLIGCALGVPKDAVTPTAVKGNLVEWDGRVVSVSGWLGKCWGNDCPIYETYRDARVGSEGDWKSGHWESDAWKDARERSINLYVDAEFQQTAYWMEFKEVVVHGKVDASCNSGCFDGADFQPKSIKMLL